MIEAIKKLRQHLLTGVSYVIPFIACGGIMLAISIALGRIAPGAPFLELILRIGSTAFALMLPVLAGYIAYSIAGKPGLVPGFIGGYLSGEVNAGFLGALLAGLLAGYIVQIIKRIPVHKYIRPIMPILIIPIVSSGIIGIIMLKVLGIPIANLMIAAGNMLRTMNTGNSIILGMILGAMIAFDMGGPINKTAFFFGAAMIKEGNFHIMGACAAAICTPPLGMGLATILRRKLWNEEEREAGIAALAMGMMGITEGAIPFAAADPLRVIPCIVFGSMAASTIAMLGKVGDHAPHGGPIVVALAAIDHPLVYGVAIMVGTIVTAILVNTMKALRSENRNTTTNVQEAT